MKIIEASDGQKHLVGEPNDDVVDVIKAAFQMTGKAFDIEWMGHCWQAIYTRQEDQRDKHYLNFTSDLTEYDEAKAEICIDMFQQFPDGVDVPTRKH